jgi:hypothetical protein
MPGTTGLNITSRPHLVMPAKAGIHDFPLTKQKHFLFLKKRSKKLLRPRPVPHHRQSPMPSPSLRGRLCSIGRSNDPTPMKPPKPKSNKSFLVLFFKKEHFYVPPGPKVIQ